MPKFFKSLLFVAFLSGFSIPAYASQWIENEHFRSRLAAVPEGGNRVAVLVLELEEGWHSYGQDPGDAGLPPHFNWDGSQNLERVDITWPKTFEKTEMEMFTVNAYEGRVEFPLKITSEKADEDVTLNLDLKIMVCNKICIPDQVKLSLPLIAASRKP